MRLLLVFALLLGTGAASAGALSGGEAGVRAAQAPGGAQARRRRLRRAGPPEAATVGLGRSCHKKADCHHKRQLCLKESDVNGKPLQAGFCALPCSVIDEGMAKVGPGSPGNNLAPTPENVEAMKKKPPPRCPKRYQCRSAGNGVPIDLCVRQ